MGKTVYVSETGRTLSEDGASVMKGSRLPRDSVMMSCIATIGKCGITAEDSFTNQQINSVICDTKKVYPPYLYYVFTQLSHKLDIAGGGGSVYTNVSKSRFSDISITLPPLSEQRRIAGILGSLDDKIELNRRISETLGAISQAIFKSWFIDFDPVIDNALTAGNEIPEALQARAKARQAMGDKRQPLPPSIQSLFPAEFDLTSQGPIPKGWKITTVGEVSTCFDNRRIPLSKRQRQQKQPGNIPYYGATSIMDYVNEWIFDDIYLLVGEDGSVMREDGSPFVQYIWGKSWVNNHAHVLQGNLSVSTEHLMLFMKNQNVAAYITGAVQQKINQMNMNGIPFLLANTELNFAFSERIRPLYEKYRYLTELNVNLSKFRNVLLPKILSNRGITSPNMGEVGV